MDSWVYIVDPLLGFAQRWQISQLLGDQVITVGFGKGFGKGFSHNPF